MYSGARLLCYISIGLAVGYAGNVSLGFFGISTVADRTGNSNTAHTRRSIEAEDQSPTRKASVPVYLQLRGGASEAKKSIINGGKGGVNGRSSRHFRQQRSRSAVLATVQNNAAPWWEEDGRKLKNPTPAKTPSTASSEGRTETGKPWWDGDVKRSSSSGSSSSSSVQRADDSKRNEVISSWWSSDRGTPAKRKGSGLGLSSSPWIVLLAAPALLAAGSSTKGVVPKAAPRQQKINPPPPPKKVLTAPPPPQPPKIKARVTGPAVAKAGKQKQPKTTFLPFFRTESTKRDGPKVAEGPPQTPPRVVATVPTNGNSSTNKSKAVSAMGANLRTLNIIVVAAAGTAWINRLYMANALIASWAVPLVEPWQALTAIAFAVNLRAVRIPGRLDGNQAAVRNKGEVRFFSPAGWAFAIWGPIFLLEMAFVVYQLLPMGPFWLADVSPLFAMAMLFQTLWCVAFRPWAADSGRIWLSAGLLGGTAVALSGAHQVLRTAWRESDMSWWQYTLVHLPVSLHFGWISAATLVNLNGYLASLRPSKGALLAASIASCYLATALGLFVSLTQGDPVYALVLAWAAAAVGHPNGWKGLIGTVDMAALQAQALTARGASTVLALAAFSLIGKKALEMLGISL